MFPIADDNSDRTISPVVNYLLIVANILVFVFLQGFGTNERFTFAFSTVPYKIATGENVSRPVVFEDPISGTRSRIPVEPTPFSVYLTLITSMFMHGSLAHIFGNMLFLWIFGDNIENAMGHARYLIFYLLCGVLASLAHVYSTIVLGGNPFIPSLGASGAISGVLGAYILLYPNRRVMAFIGYFLTEVPAWVAVGLWFVFQLVSGVGLLGGGSQAGGVAYAAHIGGFIAGLALVKIFTIGRGGAVLSRTRR
jgi:membrane associated rhomboid family serine protease